MGIERDQKYDMGWCAECYIEFKVKQRHNKEHKIILAVMTKNCSKSPKIVSY